MQFIDLILVTAYVGLVLSIQTKSFIKLYNSADGGFIQRYSCAVAFIVTTQYLQLKNNAKLRRGYMTALYVVPCALWLLDLHYCLIANVVFIAQGVLYTYLGKVLFYKFTSIAA
jgi:multisubunit Na+/H+ antiporter MnhB subunit